MRDEIYIGNLVSLDELRHSAKGSKWKDHKYIAIINGVYQQPRKKIEKYRARKNAKDLEKEYYELYKKYAGEADEAEKRADTFKRQRLEEDGAFFNYTSSINSKLEPTGSTNANLAGREAIKAKGKRYLANLYGRKTADQKFITYDRDLVDIGIDAVAATFGTAKSLKDKGVKTLSGLYERRKKLKKKKK